MYQIRKTRTVLAVIVALFAVPAVAERSDVGTSPRGPDDELGRLNLMIDASRAADAAPMRSIAIPSR